MATDLKTWTIDLYKLTGSALAGPAGALIGSLTGGLFTAALPGAAAGFDAIFTHIVPDSPENAVEALIERLDAIEKRHINHDLQTALRNALREAIYDMGGERCFPQVWRERPRQVPAKLILRAALQEEDLPHAQGSLAEQVCHFYKEMLNAIA